LQVPIISVIIMCHTVCVREKKELKARQAKHSMESVKSVMSDKTVKNKAERDRSATVDSSL